MRETGTVESCRETGVLCAKLANMCLAEKKAAEAREYCEKAQPILEKLAKETGTVAAYDDLADIYFTFGRMGGAEVDPILAEQILNEGKKAGSAMRKLSRRKEKDPGCRMLTLAFTIWEKHAAKFSFIPRYAQNVEAAKKVLAEKR